MFFPAKRKKKRLTVASDESDEDGDGDSGSDFKISGDDDDDFEDEEEEQESEESSSDEGGRPAQNKGAVRRSNRERRVIYDDDFVIDGSGSEDLEGPAGMKRTKYDAKDDDWSGDSEDGALSRKKSAKVQRSPSLRKKVGGGEGVTQT